MSDPFSPKPSERRPALGRGLSALIPDLPTPLRDSPLEVDLDLIVPNPRQPRTDFDEARLEELVSSIKGHGVIQPILVRRKGAQYEIIAGERRWRAAQRAGLLRVPVVVRDLPDAKLVEVALVENIQRENLNPMDEAQAYRSLIEDTGLTQDQVAAAVGKDRATVANILRLLKLPPVVREQVAKGRLSMGQARALLGLDDPSNLERLAQRVERRGLSVRATEALVRRRNRPRADPAPADVHTRQAEERLRLALGTRVRIVRTGQRGRLEIEFVSEDELQRLYEQLTTR